MNAFERIVAEGTERLIWYRLNVDLRHNQIKLLDYYEMLLIHRQSEIKKIPGWAMVQPKTSIRHQPTDEYFSQGRHRVSLRPGLQVIQLCSCTSDIFKERKIFFFIILLFYEHLKFHAQLSWEFSGYLVQNFHRDLLSFWPWLYPKGVWNL